MLAEHLLRPGQEERSRLKVGSRPGCIAEHPVSRVALGISQRTYDRYSLNCRYGLGRTPIIYSSGKTFP